MPSEPACCRAAEGNLPRQRRRQDELFRSSSALRFHLWTLRILVSTPFHSSQKTNTSTGAASPPRPKPPIALCRPIGTAYAGPPEDVGGPWGLADLLEALDDPDHPEHASYREWVGEHYDPDQLDLRAINGLLWLAACWGAIGPRG